MSEMGLRFLMSNSHFIVLIGQSPTTRALHTGSESHRPRSRLLLARLSFHIPKDRILPNSKDFQQLSFSGHGFCLVSLRAWHLNRWPGEIKARGLFVQLTFGQLSCKAGSFCSDRGEIFALRGSSIGRAGRDHRTLLLMPAAELRRSGRCSMPEDYDI